MSRHVCDGGAPSPGRRCVTGVSAGPGRRRGSGGRRAAPGHWRGPQRLVGTAQDSVSSAWSDTPLEADADVQLMEDISEVGKRRSLRELEHADFRASGCAYGRRRRGTGRSRGDAFPPQTKQRRAREKVRVGTACGPVQVLNAAFDAESEGGLFMQVLPAGVLAQGYSRRGTHAGVLPQGYSRRGTHAGVLPQGYSRRGTHAGVLPQLVLPYTPGCSAGTSRALHGGRALSCGRKPNPRGQSGTQSVHWGV